MIIRQSIVILTSCLLISSGVLFAQKGADPAQRYFRLICLVHLTGSGKAGDPVVPEYVAQGTAVAVAGAVQTSTMHPEAATASPVAAVPAPMSSRPGILGWGMQVSDDGKMAIVQMVAADRHAFDSILADTRPEIRVFEIGKASPAVIQAEFRKFKKDFDLTNFRVMVQ